MKNKNIINENEQFNKSLDIIDSKINKYIPYILQDLWTLGSIPDIVSKLVLTNKLLESNKKVIDLGCGKGAIIIDLAKYYDSNFIGIDIVKEFIKEGNEKLKNIKTKGKVKLIVSNILNEVNTNEKYDLVIFSYDTGILGSHKDTLIKLKNLLKSTGTIIFETAYRDLSYQIDEILTYDMIKFEIQNAGLFIKDQHVWEKKLLKKINKDNNVKIKRRINQLIKKYPQEKKIFLEYFNNQLEESELLNNKINCISFVLNM